MRITDVDTFLVDGSWRNWVFVRIEADSGLVGYGEASLEGREHAVAGAIKDFSRRLVGQDARAIRSLRRSLTRKGYWEVGPVISSAVAGVEIALWDLAGKELDTPIHRLLGGAVHERLPVYSNAWYFGADSDADLATRAASTVALGYRALKFDPFLGMDVTADDASIQRALARIGAVRDRVGPQVGLLIEGHGRFGLQAAERIARGLEPFGITFFEEPLPPGDLASLASVRAGSPVPIASGERCVGLEECRRFLEQRAVAVFQLDLVHIGGIQAGLVAADLCDSAAVPVAPHNASGPIATAATLHASAVMPNLLLQEMFAPQDAPWKDLVVRGLPLIESGTVAIPDGPGLGIEVDEAEVVRHPLVPRDLELLEQESILDRPVA